MDTIAPHGPSANTDRLDGFVHKWRSTAVWRRRRFHEIHARRARPAGVRGEDTTLSAQGRGEG